ncbi:MAG: Fe-S oxidoreductase [Deltaproteobacteria bacterium]|nr:Fe-S oxidoreductase [Deltaproteobacteria bacterium]
MRAGTIEEIHRYPVKSMLGEQLESVQLDDHGIAVDRRWAVRDEVRGDFATAKRVGALMGCRARFVGSGEGARVPLVELPDGRVFSADEPSLDERLSEALGLEVSIWALDSGELPPGPEAPGPDFDLESEMRRLMARESDEPIPDFTELPGRLGAYMGRSDRPFVDLSPLMILSTQSLARIQQAAPDSRIDVRRFRPSLLVDIPNAGVFPEQRWVGCRLRVGEVILSVELACPRCIMTTHGFADLPKDPGIMRKLVSEAAGDLGVYAMVEQGGRVTVGDAIEVLD